MSAKAKPPAKLVQPRMKALEVRETAAFERETKKLLTESERKRLRQEAAQFRELCSIISGTGGLRKKRWTLNNNKGKSGGARVIYFYDGDDIPMYLVGFYAKSDQANLTKAQKKAALKIVESVKREFRSRKKPEKPKLKLVK